MRQNPQGHILQWIVWIVGATIYGDTIRRLVSHLTLPFWDFPTDAWDGAPNAGLKTCITGSISSKGAPQVTWVPGLLVLPAAMTMTVR